MKAHKKNKDSFINTDHHAHSKSNAQKAPVAPRKNSHHKLLEYRDYLLSLRKMDLGDLIQQNKNRKVSFIPKKPTQPVKQQQTINDKNEQLSLSQQAQQETLNKTQRNPDLIKVKKINLKVAKSIDIVKNDSLQKSLKSTQEPNKQKRNSFQLVINDNFHEDDLYCHENMEEMMKSYRAETPRLAHINHVNNNFPSRDYSTQRSSRNRDFSMPSIEQRNMSEQSQEEPDNHPKHYTRSVSEGINHRKYNSCNYSTPSNAENQTQLRLNSKQNTDFFCIPLIPQRQEKENINKTFDNEHLISTQDYSTRSRGDSESFIAKKTKFEVKVTPFEYKPNFSPITRKPCSNNIVRTENQIFGESESKQHPKLSLNVSEIVKRINNRQSKSSMSDRSYRKQQQNAQVPNLIQKSRFSHQKMYSDMIKEKFNQFVLNPSTNPIEQFIFGQEMLKKKNFKTQVKDFREKNYLMMKLA